MAESIGARVREARNVKRWTVRELADLAGLPKSTVSDIESDRHSFGLANIDALSRALGVSRGYLLGQPVDPNDPERLLVHAAVEGVRAAVMDTELGEPTDIQPRPVAVLLDEVRSAGSAFAAGDLVTAARPLPSTLRELNQHVATDTPEQADALRGLVLALRVGCSVAKIEGFLDLAWLAMLRARQVAERLADPAWTGFVEFYCSHALTPYGRALTNTRRALDQIEPHASDPKAMQVYGILHLMAAFGSGVVGRDDDVRTHLTEAADLAVRTGEVNDEFELWFGPSNVGIWRVAIAVEQRAGAKVAELADQVDLTAMGSRQRRSNLYVDLGRGLAQDRRDTAAVAAFMQAETLSPQGTRSDPFVRESVERILRRAQRSAGGPDLRALARRVGVVPESLGRSS